MKAIISKALIAGAIVTVFSLNVQAGVVRPLTDTGKMSKMDKKMTKKMAPKKMAKDTGKMKKMSKM